MHYPLLVNEPVEQPIQSYSIYTILSYILIMMFNTLFTFYDLILAYSTSACYTTDIPTLSFPIQIWLYIAGYLGFALSLSIILSHSRERTPCQERIHITTYIIILMNIAWNMMGHNVLWLHYSEYVQCSLEIVIYMCIRLILGMIINIIQLYLHYYR